MQLTGAQILLNSLIQEGVTTIFGYPGNAILPIYDALATESKLKHILTRHEAAAAFAADGYARSTGKVGVCFATSGPGATNLITGITTAYLDSIPIVAITGQTSLEQIGKDGFQWVSITNITLPITKYNYLVQSIDSIAPVVSEAFKIARSGRPGPVLIDIPQNISAATLDLKLSSEKQANYENNDAIDYSQLPSILKLIQEAKKPLIVFGGGVVIANASSELQKLIEVTKIPAISTLMGKNALNNKHSHYLGWAGMHGSLLANHAIQEADLLLAIGLRFDERFINCSPNNFAKKANIIHIDIDSSEINKVIKTTNFIVGDAKIIISKLISELADYNNNTLGQWYASLQSFLNNTPKIANPTPKDGLNIYTVMRQINNLLRGNEIIVTDVGQHQLCAAQILDCQNPRHFLTSGGDGAMGFSLPAAIGASLANPEKPVLCIVGDGSIQMSIYELTTIVSNNCPIKIFLFNNHSLGLIRQLQDTYYQGRRYSIDLKNSNPDFSHIAAAYKIPFLQITQEEDMVAKISQALTYQGAILVNIQIDSESDVIQYQLQKRLFDSC